MSAPLRLLAVGAFLLVAACDSKGPSGDRLTESRVPVEVAPELRFTSLGAGWFHTCATATSGTVYCWGRNETGEIGGPAPATICRDPFLGDVPCTGTPQPVADAPPLHSLSGSLQHSCGLDAEGVAWCWGLTGFLGDGTPHTQPVTGSVPCAGPVGSGLTCRGSAAPVAGSARFTHLHASIESSGTCAVSLDGTGFCWGLNSPASMDIGQNLVPTALPTPLRFQRLLVQGLHGCGIDPAGAAWCWGSNWYGTLGNGTTGATNATAPVAVIGGHTFTQIASTLSSVCGLRSDGAAFCWGHLPSLTGVQQTYRYGGTPVLAGGPAFVALAGGGNHHCGLTAAGVAWCWGANSSGFLGDGTRTDREAPTRVRMPDGVAFTQLAAGGVHTCALAADGRLFCWGHNGFGQIGRPPGQTRRG